MNATIATYEEDDLGYEFASRRQTAPLSERVGRTAVRNLTGQQRAAQQARYKHRVAPTQKSGTQRRRQKRYGL